MKSPGKSLAELLALLDATETREIDCEEFLSRVATYVERVDSEQLPTALQSVAQHIRVCPECREELEALLEHYSSSDH